MSIEGQDGMQVAPLTPTQHLALCLATIRGGEEIPVEVIEADVMRWIKQYREPTRETVDAWAASSFELGFALRVLAQRTIAISSQGENLNVNTDH